MDHAQAVISSLGIGGTGPQGEDPVIPVRSVVCGVVEIPLPPNSVELRSPDLLAVRSFRGRAPHDDLGSVSQPLQGVGLPDADVITTCACQVIPAMIEDDPRIRPSGSDRVIEDPVGDRVSRRGTLNGRAGGQRQENEQRREKPCVASHALAETRPGRQEMTGAHRTV